PASLAYTSRDMRASEVRDVAVAPTPKVDRAAVVAPVEAAARGPARQYGDKIAERGDGRAHVALLNVTEMRGCIATLGRRASLGHVLHHDVARREAAYQKRTLVANHRPHPIIGAQRIG